MKIIYETEEEQVEAQWSKTVLAQSYSVEFSHAANFNKPVKFESNQTLIFSKIEKEESIIASVEFLNAQSSLQSESPRSKLFIPQNFLDLIHRLLMS